jgi:anti-sigma regulatory factor (Ser/Thr protein kinase)
VSGNIGSVTEHLDLAAAPSSASLARSWVRERLEDCGLDHLLDAATLGVSELVTNAFLHARTPIRVSLRTRRTRLRIEVSDEAPLTELHADNVAASLRGEATVGRGLHIVRAYALAWGVSAQDNGKVVWFEPARSLVNPPGDASELLRPPESRPLEADLVPVVLQAVPLPEFTQFQVRLLELIREMQLVALDDDSALSDWAGHLAILATAVESSRYLTPESLRELTRAATTGRTSVDLVYQVPVRFGPACIHMVDMLRAADRESHRQQLLITPSSEQEVALRDWYFSEFARQVNGQAPVAWTAVALAQG